MSMSANNKKGKNSEEFMGTRELLALCLSKWKWFVVSLCISLIYATYNILSTVPIYTRTASIIVKDGKNGSDTNQQLEELGIDMTSSNITDELVAIHSPEVIYEVVKRLKLNISYYQPGRFRDQILYAESLPVEVELPDMPDNESASFMLKLNGNGSGTISQIRHKGQELQKSVKVEVDKTVNTPLGKLTVSPTLFYKKGSSVVILVNRNSLSGTADRVSGSVTTKLQTKNSNIIDIKCQDESTARAENILNMVITIYSENWVNNRNQISKSTNEFIKERLAVIEKELGDVDDDISSFKSSHSMPDVNAAASQAMAQATETSRQETELSNQLYMVRHVKNYVTDNQYQNQLLPANSGINNTELQRQINEYNTTQLQRNNLVANSGEQNPLVIDLDRQLATQRNAIVNTLNNELTTLGTQQRAIQSSHGQALARMTANPSQAKYLLSVERQQKVKESLYLFLLQKREENELSQAFTAYNTRVIASPHGNNLPLAPVKSNIIAIALAVGLIIPAMILFLVESTNTTVRGRKDINGLSIPFVGEIPLWNQKNRWWEKLKLKKKKKGKKAKKEAPQIVINPKSRNIINEAFRMVRTNLEFITCTTDAEHEGCKVIMLTSFNPGSGKTFACANLGAAFSIREKKVLCIDLDMRRESLSAYVNTPKVGLSNYLGGYETDCHDLIIHDDTTNLDIMPVGTIPPNPAELLLTSKMRQMLEELRGEYDYILLDCPPLEIVADASIISRSADATLFVVRAGLMPKHMIPELEVLYEEKKLKNLCIVLNGTDLNNQHGYNHYGYGYGRYGYGSSGYGYGE